MFAVTIDGASSQDLDDAIWCEKTSDGYQLKILIANVADTITPESKENALAVERQFSIYSGARGCVKPMLPKRLSENRLSLLSNSERDVLSVDVYLNDVCEVLNINISAASFKNIHRLTHDMVPLILDDQNHPLHAGMCLMRDVAEQLLSKRRDDGSLAIYDISSGWASDEYGVIRKLSDIERNIGYVIVQEFMIVANAQLSEFCLKNNIPIMYRNHQVNMAAPSVKSIATEIQLAFSAHNENVVRLLAKRLSLFASKAVMSNTVGGHYGLNLPAYSWFTSPIRRYPDLVNQRNILAYLRKSAFVHSQEDIAVMAEMYNQKVVQVTAETSEHHAKKAQEKAVKVLEKNQFAHVDSLTLHQTLKAFFNGAGVFLSDEMHAEVLKRATSKTMEVKTLALLFAHGWKGFTEHSKREIIRVLMKDLPLSTSIVNVMTQKFGLQELQSEFTEDNKVHPHEFTCKSSAVYNSQTLVSRSNPNTVKKSAGQQALWALLCQLAGVDDLIPPAPRKQSASSKAASTVLEQTDLSKVTNPVGFLQELCQKKKYGLPTYDYQRSGQDHAPTFVSTVIVMNGTGASPLSATGPLCASKKEAAKVAAMLWLKQYANSATLTTK